MSSFVIKIIAIITMTIDHINYLLNKKFILNAIGRMAFPLFCYQIVVGYDKTKSLCKYIIRMIIFAIISQFPYYMFAKMAGNDIELNVIYTLTLGLITMFVYDLKVVNKNNKLVIVDKEDKTIFSKDIKYDKRLHVFISIIKIVLLVLIMLISEVCKTEYGAWGIALMLFIHACYPFKNSINLLGKNIKTKKIINNILFIIGMLLMCIALYYKYVGVFKTMYVIIYILITFIPAFIMLLHNGKKGPGLKYFFYIYYPLQFLIIVLISYLK
ncbi:MAG: hypothetical protein IKG56_05120 [Clostridia bacterium]|nr:hypothetical protein [Clostridia bacterium]